MLLHQNSNCHAFSFSQPTAPAKAGTSSATTEALPNRGVIQQEIQQRPGAGHRRGLDSATTEYGTVWISHKAAAGTSLKIYGGLRDIGA